MEDLFEDCNTEEAVEVVDIDDLKKACNVEDEIRNLDMTSLGDLMLLGQTASKYFENPDTSVDEDTYLHRLSLAYEKLRSIPKILAEEWAPYIKILDISYNEFDNLDFLIVFKELTSFICDHNPITSKARIPYLPKLELLWMNHCKIAELYPWSRMLQYSCPNLKYLSLMGNSISPYYIWGADIIEGIHYRWFLISLFPKLIHLDGRLVTDDDKQIAPKLYQRPLMERIVSRTQQNLPEHLRVLAEKVSDLFTTPPEIFEHYSSRNSVI